MISWKPTITHPGDLRYNTENIRLSKQKNQKIKIYTTDVSFILIRAYCWNRLEIFKIKKIQEDQCLLKEWKGKSANIHLTSKSIKGFEQISPTNTKNSKL